MKPWHERIPGSLEREFEAFAEAGYQAELIEGPPASLDVIVRVRVEAGGRSFDLTVNYPDSYPYLRPHVLLEDELFDRHQNPVAKNLCLLDRSTRAWQTGMTAAVHIAEQLPKLLTVLAAPPDERKELEAPQGEPLSAFLTPGIGAVVLVPNLEAESAEAQTGMGTLRLLEPNFDPAQPALRAVLATLSQTPGADGKKWSPLGKADDELLERARGGTIKFRWVRIDLTPDDIAGDGSAARLQSIAQAQWPELAVLESQPLAGGEIAVLGVVFAEEVELDQYADSWSFIVSYEAASGDASVLYRAVGERASVDDLLARIPTVRSLRTKTIALAGLGALGAPASLELARSQIGTLRMLDFDWVELGTTVRWPFGVDAVMHEKTGVIDAFVRSNYPYVRIERFPLQIGAPTGGDREPERLVLDRFLASADVLLDLTAERGINYLLSELATEEGIPQVFAWGTEGGWGGAVARIIPGVTACWYCLMAHLYDGTIPTPPHDATGTAQPRGCASATFTGTAFDLLPIVAQAVRLTVQTLTGAEEGGYPDSPKNVMILASREANGMPITPRWTDYDLTPHATCTRCQSVSS